MRICSCRIDGFGKFQNKEFIFDPGINLILGENESGKSTLQAFLFVMLFGLERKRGKAAKKDDYHKYFPWKNAIAYGGALTFESGGKEFLLQRNFLIGAERESLVCLTDHEELDLAAGDLEMLLGEIGKAAFSGTLSIGQGARCDEKELKQLLEDQRSGYTSPAEETIELKEVRRRLQTIKKESLRQYEERRSALRLEKERYHARGLQMQVEAERIQEKLTQSKLQQEKLQQEKLIQEKLMQEKPIQEKQGQTNRIHKRDGDAIQRGKKSGLHTAAGLLFALSIIIALSITFLMPSDAPIFGRYKIFLSVICFAIGFLFWSIYYMTRPNPMRAKPMRSRGSHLTESSEGAEVFGSSERTEAFGSSERAEAFESSESTDANLLRLTQAIAELRIRIRHLQEELYDKGQEAERLFEKADMILAKQDETSDQAQAEAEAAALALRTIEEASLYGHSHQDHTILEHVGKILSELTNGKYYGISETAGEFRIIGSEGAVPLFQLSYGTREQVYFAMRIASAELLSDGENLPIFADELFAAYDDGRLTKGLRFLQRWGHQVFLFSCNQRELQLMQQNEIEFVPIRLNRT